MSGSSSSGDKEECQTCDGDEDEDKKSGLPRAASHSSSTSEDDRDMTYYYHTSDEEEEDMEIGAAPGVEVKKETRHMFTDFHTGFDAQEMIQSCFAKLVPSQSRHANETLAIPSGSQQAEGSLAIPSGSQQLEGSLALPSGGNHDEGTLALTTGHALMNKGTALNVQLNVTQNVKVEKATNVNQSFGGSQNISETATINEGQTGGELSRADRIMKRTISNFQSWNQGMVRTAALDQVLNKLNSGTTWLTIKGNPGEGKTTVGYMALEELHRCGRQVFEVKSPDDFMEIIETCSRPFIMLDDVFGNLQFDEAVWATWKPAVCQLLKEREHRSHEKEDTTSKKNVTVILIGRDYVLNSAFVDLGRLSYVLTSDKHVVYMDNSVKRSTEEKREIWETISRSSGVELDKMTVDKILRVDVPHGYPHVCRLYTTVFRENKSICPIDFFSKPLSFLNESVSNISKDTSTMFLFKEMIKGGGKISIRELGRLDPTYKISQTADNLVGTYIRVEEDCFQFDHPSIYDSVAFHLCSRDPIFVIEKCNLSFIHERVRILFSHYVKRTRRSASSLVVNVNRCYAEDLAVRFAAEIMARNFVHVLSHQVFTDRTFVGLVMSRIKTSLKSLLSLTDQNQSSYYDEITFLSLVPSSKSPELLKYIDKCQDITLTEADERTVLYATCRYAATDVLQYLIHTRISLDVNVRFNLDETPLMIAAKTRDVGFVDQILSLSPDLNARDALGRTVVHYLSTSGLVSTLSQVIESGVEIDVEDSYVESPLFVACRDNKLDVVQLLVEKGVRVDEKSLFQACRAGNIHMVKLLFKKEHPRTKYNLYLCLSLAIEGGNIEIMHFLVGKGASVNPLKSYLPPLHAACYSRQSKAVQWLLQQGAGNSKDWEGKTPLHRAVEKESSDFVDFLLKAGIAMNVQNNEGDTALHKSAERGSVKCVDLLLKAGAALDIQNTGGDTALQKTISAMVNKQSKGSTALVERAAGRRYKKCFDLLLTAGAAVNIQNDDGNTALHNNIESGFKRCGEVLVKVGTAVDKKRKTSDTSIHKTAVQTVKIQDIRSNTAAEKRFSDCFDMILTAGATVNIQNDEGKTALHNAAERGLNGCVEHLLKAGTAVDIQSVEGETPLHLAARVGFKECVDVLLKAGATVNIQNDEGKTALHNAAERGLNGCFEHLLKAGTAVDIQSVEGETPLHLAARVGFKECVDLLLKTNTKVDMKNEQGNTALHSAAGRGFKDCVEVLLKAGATVNIQNKEGDTALHMVERSLPNTCIDFLLKAGATVNIQNNEGNTALHSAAMSGSEKCIALLLKAGATVNIQNKEGYTALHSATWSRSLRCVLLLLRAGATKNIQSMKGDTALHIAARQKSEMCVSMLLHTGFKADIQNNEGITPLHAVVKSCLFGYGMFSVCQKLIERGVSFNNQSAEGDTPLHRLCLSFEISSSYMFHRSSYFLAYKNRGYKKLARMLMDRGADVCIQNKQGTPALHGKLKQLLQEDDYSQD